MKVSQVVENADGSLSYNGNLSGDELGFVVELGLNILLARGALPVATDPVNFHPQGDSVQ